MFIVPVLCWVAFTMFVLKWSISLTEALIQAGVTIGVVLLIFSLGSYSTTYDTMLVNGKVTELRPVKRDCPNGWVLSTDSFCTNYDTREVRDYPDACSTDSKGKKTCTPRYHTEYRYDYDWERRYWILTSLGSHEIPRVDYQGVNYPPRFTAARVGDPATASVSYTNYIKGASDTLFSEGEPEDTIPLAYPSVRDYYVANRFLVEGLSFPNAEWQAWNAELSALNAELQDRNVIIVVTNSKPDFATMLARSWDSHNINDIVVVIGSPDGKAIDWVDVRSWSASELVNIEIRDVLKSAGAVDGLTKRDAVLGAIKSSIDANFKMQPMENFEYLADDIPAPTWAMVLAFIFLLIVTPALSYFFHHNDRF